MKKLIIAIALIALCLAFAACGSNQTEKPAAPSATDIFHSDALDVSKPEPQPEKHSRYIELSGNSEDTFVAEQDCYTEGDEVVIYFQKGVTVRGDMLKTAEKVMDDLCISTGLNFAQNYIHDMDIDYRDDYLEKGVFADVNLDNKKITIIVINNPENVAVQFAYNNGTILEALDFDAEQTSNQAMYHELSHVIHLRNGVDLSSTLNEGFAAYIADRTQRRIKMPSWDAIQYYSGLLFDDSVIAKGEEGFSSYYKDSKDENYQYGFRFMSFLHDVYGNDIFVKIMKEATAQKYDSAFDYYAQEEGMEEDTQQMIAIIKSQTGEDVFDKFAEWYDANWEKEVSDYYAHLTALGLW